MATKEEARELLLKWCPEGTTLYYVRRFMGKTGFQRLRFYVIVTSTSGDKPYLQWIDNYMKAMLADILVEDAYAGTEDEGLGTNETGSDLVSNLSWILHGKLDALRSESL